MDVSVRRITRITRITWKTQAELLQIDAYQRDVSRMAADALFTEIEAEQPADSQASAGPAQADAAQGHGLIEKLKVSLSAGRLTGSGGDLPGAGTVQPEPEAHADDENAGKCRHEVKVFTGR